MIITNENVLLIVIAILFTTIIILFLLHYRLQKRLKSFLISIKAENISDSLNILSNDIKTLQSFKNETDEYLSAVENRLKKSLRAVHTIRFNPFQGSSEGGNQSFATVFLNENGDGTLISSIYTRDRVSVYSKGLKDFASEHGMSEEEIEALEMAKQKLK